MDTMMSISKSSKTIFKSIPRKFRWVVGCLIVAVGLLSLVWPEQFGLLKELLLGPNSVETSQQTTSDSQGLNETQTVNGQLYMVTEVVDGDTIKIDVKGQEQTIRLIGLDTPEVVDPRKTVECFGKEASQRTTALVEGKQVKVEADDSQGNSDTYGRLLRYVYLPEGQMINLMLIQQGYAYEYTYSSPYKYQTAFKSAQVVARTDEQGLWSSSKCNGQRQLESD